MSGRYRPPYDFDARANDRLVEQGDPIDAAYLRRLPRGRCSLSSLPHATGRGLTYALFPP